MNFSRYKVATIPITVKPLLYNLFIISGISGTISSGFLAATQTKDFIYIFLASMITIFSYILFITGILDMAKKRHDIAGTILIGMVLIAIFSLFVYSDEFGLLYNNPYILVLFLLSVASLAVSGIIIIVYGNYLSAKTPTLPPHV